MSQLHNEAKTNINNAQTNSEVNNAKTISIQNIERIQPRTQSKANGRNELNQKVEEQKTSIAIHPNSTIE
ncbi:DUF1542 domain-containing protein [Staphylococcus saccharolyticus]|uniref:DUF1542 domain-containing protein n=1 Tax=Staphylococcus saccharolyticus TaxID=33028 RepID=UPI0032DF7B34